MKFIQNPWFAMGAAALGLLIASCSSKTEDKGDGAGGSGDPSSSLGGANDGTGGTKAASTTRATGGKPPTDTSAGDTGGVYIHPATGGATSFDPETYCNGIFKGKQCGTTQVSADIRVVNMLLVLDESGSMNDAPVTGAGSKWSILFQALNTALTKVESDINFGLLLYPYKEGGIDSQSGVISDVCAVPGDASAAVNIPIGASSGTTAVQQILQKVQSQTPAGGTPTAEALARAYDYFATGDGRALPGTRWVLLATDGGPNCNTALTCPKETCTQNMDCKCGDNDCNTTLNCCESSGAKNYGYICLDDIATTSAITKLASIGVKTFVVGIPGSEAYASSLNTFATAGKMPNSGANGEKYYPVSASSALTDLTQAFESITSKLVTSCDIELTETPQVSVDKINVALDCVLQTPLQSGTAPDAAGVDGFYLDYSTDPAHLKLVGKPCAQLSTTGVNKVDIIAGCQTIN